MGWSALLKADLLSLSKSWVLRGWLIVLALTELMTVGGTLAASRIAPVPASTLITTQLSAYLVIWSTIIIVLSAGSVSLETDIVADSILSRACTRTQYIGAKLLSRAVVIGGVYVVFAGAAGYAAWRYGANDITLPNLCVGIGIVGLALLMLVALGVAMSVVFNNTIFSVIGLLLVWYVASPIFSFVGADYLSPVSLVRNLPGMLKDSSAPQVVQVQATPTSLTVAFSKDVDTQKAEQTANYQIDSNGQSLAAQTAVYDRARTSVVLGGLQLAPGESAKVTVRGVTDRAGNDVSPAADSASVLVPASKPDPDRSLSPADAASKETRESGRPRGTSTASDRTPPRVTQCVAAASSLKVSFSKELDRKDAEAIEHYIVESPPGSTRTPRVASWDAQTRTVLLSGLDLPSGAPVKVTVKDVKDVNGNPIARSGSTATYSEVTTWKYVLGFGIPTLLASLLAVAWFSRRDL